MPDESKAGSDLHGSDSEARREAAKTMGSASTEAKTRAARENAKKGGRPKGMNVSEETRRKISETKRKKKAKQGKENTQ